MNDSEVARLLQLAEKLLEADRFLYILEAGESLEHQAARAERMGMRDAARQRLESALRAALTPPQALGEDERSKWEQALRFAAGAVEDAIYLEDGLDGGAGEAVLATMRDLVPSLPARPHKWFDELVAARVTRLTPPPEGPSERDRVLGDGREVVDPHQHRFGTGEVKSYKEQAMSVGDGERHVRIREWCRLALDEMNRSGIHVKNITKLDVEAIAAALDAPRTYSLDEIKEAFAMAWEFAGGSLGSTIEREMVRLLTSPVEALDAALDAAPPTKEDARERL